MKEKKNYKFLIISIFLCLMSIGFLINPLFTNSGKMLKTAAPKNILVYTQYTDLSRELPNTLDAINQT
ncbi:MAG: hypothetical protein JXA99_08005 [Candidatus Lokiarchaeota archaeon]|nr:hypothetical protein [Candidatus Lokiarchaeota archaeon]